ncbi:MAG: hypothetical protein QNJ47_05135, partial [Nostocaceae cyanobacterium]|nr:hypothetical protein [Nostocaceae cyanobacterium]
DLKYEIGFLAIKNSCSRREIASFRGAESHSDTLRGKQSYAVGFTLTRLEHLDSYRDSATPKKECDTWLVGARKPRPYKLDMLQTFCDLVLL